MSIQNRKGQCQLSRRLKKRLNCSNNDDNNHDDRIANTYTMLKCKETNSCLRFLNRYNGFSNNYHFLTIIIVIIITTLFFLISSSMSRRLQRCELAGILYILDVDKVDLPLWLCIAEFESRYNTHAIGKRNDDGSKDYGIFQISDKFWCRPENETDYYAFNECNMNCTELIKDDITEAVKCARTIVKFHGWNAWTVYEEFCNGTLNNADDCFE